MRTRTRPDTTVTVGVDTHTDRHVAAALDQIGRLLGTHAVPSTDAGAAPDGRRTRLRRLSLVRLVAAAAAFRPGALITPAAATKLALKSIAVRYRRLDAEVAALDAHLGQLLAEAAPDLLAVKGVGTD